MQSNDRCAGPLRQTIKSPIHDMTDSDALLVHATCPSRDIGLRIAEKLVEERLAACANLLPGALSTYRWEGRVEQDEECLLFIKTHRARLEPLIEAIRSLHPDDVPEIIATPIVAGLPDYLAWLQGQTSA